MNFSSALCFSSTFLTYASYELEISSIHRKYLSPASLLWKGLFHFLTALRYSIQYGRFMPFWLNYIDLNFQAILLMPQYDYYLPPMFLYGLKDKGIHPARNRAPGNNSIPPHLRCVHSGPLKHSWCHLDWERTIPFTFYRVVQQHRAP